MCHKQIYDGLAMAGVSKGSLRIILRQVEEKVPVALKVSTNVASYLLRLSFVRSLARASSRTARSSLASFRVIVYVGLFARGAFFFVFVRFRRGLRSHPHQHGLF